MNYAEKGSFLTKILENTSVHWFSYNLKENVIYVPDKTCHDFECSSLYKENFKFAKDIACINGAECLLKMFDKIKMGYNSADAEFIKKSSNEHFHAVLTLSEYSKSEAFGIIEPLPEKQLLESSINLMQGTYYRIACIDINANSMKNITIAQPEKSESESFYKDYGKAISAFSNQYVLEEYQTKFINVMSPENLKRLFDSGLQYMDITYQRLESGVPRWVRTELIPMPDYSENNRRVMWYVKNISTEKALEKRISDKYMEIYTDANLKLQTVLNSISGGFKISREDENLSYCYIGESSAGLFGYTVEELMKVTHGNAIENIYTPDFDYVLEKIHSDLKSGNSYYVKYRVKCKNGSIKWIVDNGIRVVTQNGERLLYCFYHDVTELENSNNELKNALIMLNQIVSSLSCGILAYKLPERKILTLNDEAKRLFGLENSDLADIISAEELPQIMKKDIFIEDVPTMADLKKLLKNTGDCVEYEFKIRHKNGEIFKIHVKTRLLEFNVGEKFILSTMQDVTEQSILTSMLKDERKQYRDALISNCLYAFSADMTDGIILPKDIIKNNVNAFNYINITSETTYDEFVDEWITNRTPRFINEKMINIVKRDYIIQKFQEGENTLEVEYYNSMTDKYIRITALLSERSSDSHIMAFIIGTDTTEGRKKEEQTKQALVDAYEAAKRADSAKSDFLSRMSHDIRTPMNVIIGMTAIAGAHLDDKERVTDCLSKITVSSRHLLSLINEVLDMSKIESGKVELNETEFNISDLIDNVISMMRSSTKAKNQHLRVHINNVVHEKVIGDDLRIRQAFVNLLSNSIKYTPPQGCIDLYIAEKNSNNPKLGFYEFIFKDNGIGMDEEFVNHIFEPFARANDSRVSREQGTGLGMAITNNLLHMMNGDINVKSKLGEGTEITVTMTLKLQETENVSYDKFVDLPILVADDEQFACESTCQMLNEMGMCSEWVLSGAEAIEKVIKRHETGNDYFAVILDWKMPEMDGIEATRRIRQLAGTDVTIIIISAYDWSDIELEARAAGADAFISKPLFKSRLAHLFHEIISGEKESKKEGEISSIEKEDFSGNRILLAEDNDLNAEITTEILNMMGAEVDRAENGKVLVDKFSDSKPDYYKLIFMDIQMPIMNGNEAASAIRSLPRKDAHSIPIIAMTANAFSDDVQAALNAGMNEHISKPLSFSQLVGVMHKWLKSPENNISERRD